MVCHGDGRLVDVATMHPGLAATGTVTATITSAAFSETGDSAAVTFTYAAQDSEGNPVDVDLTTATGSNLDYLRFTIARLIPAAAGSGDADSWFFYGPRSHRNKSQLEKIAEGTYRFTFLEGTVLDPAWVGYTHRVGIELYPPELPVANPTFDFVPNGTPFTVTRDIVTTAACNSCHGQLGSRLGTASFHGGRRIETKLCALCHNPNNDLAGLGPIDFSRLVHGIHSAKDLGSIGDFSEVTYPQDRRNCATCHAGPDGAHWNTRPTIIACGSCHDGVDFVTGTGHEGGPQADNTGCKFCHTATKIQGYHLTENSTPHNPGVPEGLANFEYVIEEVTVNASNQAVVTFHINKDGAPLDLSTYPPAGFSGGPSFLVAYALPQDGVDTPADYNNRGRSAGQPASVTLQSLAASLTGTPASYTAVLTSAPFPADATMRAVALQAYFTQLRGDPNSTEDDVGRHTYSVVKGVTGDTVRREVVDVPKCLNCHEIFEGHGGSRVSNVQVCVICHNPNLSSSGRTVDPALAPQDTKDDLNAAGYDGDNPLTWPEATNNMKDMIHGIHAAGVRNFPYEFVRNRNNGIYYNWSEVTFPGILSNCLTCHKPGTFDADLPAGVLFTTDITTDGVNATRADVIAARNSMPNDTDLINSPTVATCYMCHDSNPAAYHFGQNGGVIDVPRASARGE